VTTVLRSQSLRAPPSLRLPVSSLCVAACLAIGVLSAHAATVPYGLEQRTATRPYLSMPAQITGKLPRLLSQTGAFKDTPRLVVSDGLIPYELIESFWSDGARKQRWIAVPDGKIGFAPTGDWTFPNGTVLVKTFELPTDAAHPEVVRRLETRVLVRNSSGGVYGVVYKWRADGSDAELLGAASHTEEIPIRDANGQTHQQTWYYPSRQDCLTCHTARTGGVLGVRTRQLNRSVTYPSGTSDNELRAWNHIGLFAPGFQEEDLASFARLAAPEDTSRSLEERARSYLDVNCSQCHRPGGTIASFDARYDTPLAQQGLIDGAVVYDLQLDRPRVISAHDIWRSVAYMRADTNSDIRMPPLARETVDERGVGLLREWILSMPGRDVLEPPVITPAGGNFDKPVRVVLSVNTPGAEIRYTTDGSKPGASDSRYEGPLLLSQPTVLRARAFKEGLTRSITSQQVYVVNPTP
jgi:uncharacterized repeat protein (TIGR03806 family)